MSNELMRAIRNLEKRLENRERIEVPTIHAGGAIGGGGTANYLAQFTAPLVIGDSDLIDNIAGGDITLTAALTANRVWTLPDSDVAFPLTAAQINVITTSSDGVTNPSTIAAFNAGGQLTVDDLFVAEYIYHNGDLDTYLYLTDDRLRIAVGGVDMLDITEAASDTIVWNEGGVDVDYRIEGVGEANALFVQGSNGYVGIGTGTPTTSFQIDNAVGNQFSIKFGGTLRFLQSVGASVVDIDPRPTSPAASSLRYFRTTNTTGTKAVQYLRGDGTATVDCQIGVDGNVTYFNTADVGIGATAPPTANGGKVLFFGDNTADPTMAANTAGCFGKDVGGTVEFFGVDEAGNVTQLTAHNYDLILPTPGKYSWIPYFSNAYLGIEKAYDMEALFDWVMAQGGPDFRAVRRLPAAQRRDWNTDQDARRRAATERGESYRMKQKPKWFNNVNEGV